LQTANLDGETNLKRREVVKPVAEMIGLRAAGAPFLVGFCCIITALGDLRACF
jgi:hypothetical protein